MLALALLVLNHVSVIDVARGIVQPDRAVELEGARSNTADWTADQYRAARTQWPKLLALVSLCVLCASAVKWSFSASDLTFPHLRRLGT